MSVDYINKKRWSGVVFSALFLLWLYLFLEFVWV